jgi:hypothetical protein
MQDDAGRPDGIHSRASGRERDGNLTDLEVCKLLGVTEYGHAHIRARPSARWKVLPIDNRDVKAWLCLHGKKRIHCCRRCPHGSAHSFSTLKLLHQLLHSDAGGA